MRDLRTLLPVLLLALLAGCNTAPSMPTPDGLQKSATFTVRQSQVQRLAFENSGEGTLIYQGWQYPFTFQHPRLDIAGSTPVDLNGAVYNMERLQDFEGTYTLVNIEIESGEGPVGAWGKNENGVVAHIRFEGQDVSINLQSEGVKFTLK